jgi:hypothetical protein
MTLIASSPLPGPSTLSAYSTDSDSSYDETPSFTSFTPFTPSVYLTWNKPGADIRSFSLTSLPSKKSQGAPSDIGRPRSHSDPPTFKDRPSERLSYTLRGPVHHRTDTMSMYNKPRPLPIRPLPTPSSSGLVSFSLDSSPSSYGFSSPDFSSPSSSPPSSAPSTPPPRAPLHIECKSSLASRRKVRCLPIPPPLVFPAIAPTECSTPLALLPMHDKDGDGVGEALDWDVLNDILCGYSEDISMEA